MKVVSLSYNVHRKYKTPDAWLDRTGFYAGVLQKLADYCEVVDLHFIGFQGIRTIGKVTHHFLKPSLLNRHFPVRFHRYVKKLGPDVVIVHGLIVPWQVILMRVQLGRNTKILVQHHKEGPGRFPRNVLQRFADRFINAYLFTTIQHAEPWLRKGIIANWGKVWQLFEGSSACRPTDRNEARKATGTGPGLVYLWVGRLISFKDPLTVVTAFLAFVERGYKADLYMIFQNADLLNDVKLLLEAHPGAAPFVHLVGAVNHDELTHWYNSADFFVLGSHEEATSISVCEAMSCGCVPILTDIPAFREMTEYGKCGLLFPPGDDKSLVEMLERSTRLDLAIERQKVLDRFQRALSFDAISSKLSEILTDLRKKKPAVN